MLNHKDDSMQNFTHKCSIHTVYNAMCSLMQPARTWPSLLNWQKCLVHVKGSVLTIECMQEQSFQCLGVHIALLPLCLLNVVVTYHLYFQLLIMNESYQVYCSVISAKSNAISLQFTRDEGIKKAILDIKCRDTVTERSSFSFWCVKVAVMKLEFTTLLGNML